MVLKKDKNIQRFLNICYYLTYKVDYFNSESKFDINKDLENIGSVLFKHLYSYELEDLNKKKKNHPAIDLGELTQFIGIQVTTTDTTTKINNTIDKFFKHKLEEEFKNGLKILIFSFDEDENLRKHASERLKKHFPNGKKSITGEDFVEILFLTDLANKFRRLDKSYQKECLQELNQEIVTPLINRIKDDEDIIIHKPNNAKKLEEFYDENGEILKDLEAIQNKLSSLSFETRVLLFDLIYLAHESDNFDDIDLYLLSNVGEKIVLAGLTGNFEELMLYNFIKTDEELFVGNSDVPLRAAILRMPIKNKNRYFGWATLRNSQILLPNEMLKMVQFLDFRVFDK